MTQEEKFLEELNIFRNEVILFSKFLYTELAIHEIANKNKKILGALNHSPTFWNTILSALQSSTFITLGRIFDPDSKKRTIHTLFKVAEQNKIIFTKESFESRWVRDRDKKQIEDWLPEYLKSVYVPTDNEFRKFRKFIADQKRVYKEIYGPIRHQFGHRILHKKEDVKVLFDKVEVRELEKFCVRLWGIHEALWQLYHNGHGPLLPIKRGSSSTKNILKTKFEPYTEKPASAQFIEEAAVALNLLIK